MDENQLVDEILILFAAVMKQLQMHLLTWNCWPETCSTVKIASEIKKIKVNLRIACIG
jgi:hypothetical protein